MKRQILVFGIALSAILALSFRLSIASPAIAQEPERLNSLERQSESSVASAAVSGGILRFPMLGGPFGLASLDPALFNSGTELGIEMQIFEGLTQFDQNLSVIPAIASSWASSNARVWSFTLRNNVYFHNGRQVKAGDFVYSWNRAKSAGGDYAFLLDDVSTFAAPSDFTFVVTLTNPSANFPIRAALPIFSVIPSEAAATIGTHPVGAGAFQFVRWIPDSKIFLRRFSNYYTAPAYLSGIEYRLYTDTNAQWADFQAGNLDVTSIPADLWPGVRINPNVITHTVNLVIPYGISLSSFPDVRVRKAFQRAINRAAIASNPVVALYDPLPIANGVVSPGKGSYNSSDIVIPYDPTEALYLLAAAGWTDTNSDGILDNGAGTNLSVVVHDSIVFSAWHAEALAIANNLSNIGGNGVGAAVALTTTQSAATIKRLGWSSDYPDPDNDLFIYETGGIFANRLSYSGATFDGYLDTARSTLNEAARNAAFHSADAQLVITDAAVIPIYYGATQVLTKPYVRDLRITAQGVSATPLKYAWKARGRLH